MWGVLDGTTIHIATQDIDGDVYYSSFNTSTDAWVIEKEVVYTAANTPQEATLGCSIGIRSDGDKIVLFTTNDGT